ncbi:MAG: anti-sigma factor family protein [Bacillota bacterium]
MTCKEIIPLLSRYIDNDLDELRRRRVDVHLGRCASCSLELTTLFRAVKVMRAVAEVDPPRDFSLTAMPSEVTCKKGN